MPGRKARKKAARGALVRLSSLIFEDEVNPTSKTFASIAGPARQEPAF